MNLMNSFNQLVAPLSKNMHLVILGLYAYVLLTQVKDNEYITMIVLTVATCMAICYLQKGSLREGMGCGENRDTPPEGFQNKPTRKRRVRKEGFENAPGIVRQVPDVMGAYDGLCLQTGNRQYWMKSPDETALVPNDALFTF